MIISNISTQLYAYDQKGASFDIHTSLEEVVRDEARSFKTLQLGNSLETKGRSPGRFAKLKLTAKLSPDGFDGQLHALINAQVTHTGSIPLSVDLDAILRRDQGAQTLTDDDYITHLRKSVHEALVNLDSQASLLRSGNTTLIKALDSPEFDIRTIAARTLGERRSSEAVAPLCSHLADDNDRSLPAMIGALSTIGGEQASRFLIDWAGTDDRKIVMIIEPLSAIGGQNAQSFLEMVASGHENPGVQRAAEESLARIRGNLPHDTE